MSLKDQILAATGRQISPRQTNFLRTLTGFSFWKPVREPAPNSGQASLLISACVALIEARKTNDHTTTQEEELVEAIQIWFPDFDNINQVKMHFFRKKASNEQHTDESEKSEKSGSGSSGSGSSKPEQPERKSNGQFKPKKQPQTDPENVPPVPTPEQKPEPKPKPVPRPKDDVKVVGGEYVQALIEAGLTNLWMVGPAGCGKTTICGEVAETLGMPITVVPCGAGTSATTFLGYKYPEREPTPFVQAFGQPGIIVLDEFTALEAQVAQIVNGALANNELSATTGTITRDPECIIIATSNTFGFGADRMYASNNQLDASTIDRFACGVIPVDYSKEYEQQYDAEVVRYVWELREIIARNGMRKLASTRSIIAASKLKQHGLDWKSALTVAWSKDEKAHL